MVFRIPMRALATLSCVLLLGAGLALAQKKVTGGHLASLHTRLEHLGALHQKAIDAHTKGLADVRTSLQALEDAQDMDEARLAEAVPALRAALAWAHEDFPAGVDFQAAGVRQSIANQADRISGESDLGESTSSSAPSDPGDVDYSQLLDSVTQLHEELDLLMSSSSAALAASMAAMAEAQARAEDHAQDAQAAAAQRAAAAGLSAALAGHQAAMIASSARIYDLAADFPSLEETQEESETRQ